MNHIIDIFKSIFFNPVLTNDLEAYINSGNPQNENDVVNLTREFEQQRQYLRKYGNE